MRNAPASSLAAVRAIHGAPSIVSCAPATGASSVPVTAPRTTFAAESTSVTSSVAPSDGWSSALETTPCGL